MVWDEQSAPLWLSVECCFIGQVESVWNLYMGKSGQRNKKADTKSIDRWFAKQTMKFNSSQCKNKSYLDDFKSNTMISNGEKEKKKDREN